ncbi:unnamed protein product [Arctogadus glacialis]
MLPTHDRRVNRHPLVRPAAVTIRVCSVRSQRDQPGPAGPRKGPDAPEPHALTLPQPPWHSHDMLRTEPGPPDTPPQNTDRKSSRGTRDEVVLRRLKGLGTHMQKGFSGCKILVFKGLKRGAAQTRRNLRKCPVSVPPQLAMRLRADYSQEGTNVF